MWRLIPFLCILFAFTQTAISQDHLIPDTDIMADPDDYKPKLRELLAGAFADSVNIRVVVVPDLEPEYAVGLKTRQVEPNGSPEFEVFVLELSAKLDDSLRIEATERIIKNGGKVYGEEYYRKLKARAPSDYHQIKTARSGRAVPKQQAQEISDLWHEELLNVRQNTAAFEFGGVIHADAYYFSAKVPFGTLSGHVESPPDPETRTVRLVTLVETMANYARGKADLETLKKSIEEAQKP